MPAHDLLDELLGVQRLPDRPAHHDILERFRTVAHRRAVHRRRTRVDREAEVTGRGPLDALDAAGIREGLVLRAGQLAHQVDLASLQGENGGILVLVVDDFDAVQVWGSTPVERVRLHVRRNPAGVCAHHERA